MTNELIMHLIGIAEVAVIVSIIIGIAKGK